MDEACTDQRVQFILRAFLGSGACLAMLAALTIGVLVAPAVALLGYAFVPTAGADRSIAGSESGVSVMLLLVAWQNREGQGTICTMHTR
jgi:hypothetical protein